ncbi:MAG: glycosyltransferase family 2 protein [Elusimicrobiaceae bacterium]|nr:glycosyltransferase family 2 protein [Elusimicrobiaceae bacterium]
MLKNVLQIILITYNRSNQLKKTFEQIFSVSSPIKDFNITIIDNNSTDDTAKIVAEYQKKFSNLSYIKNKHNIGGNANIMKAFYLATYEYVWVLADNDHYCFDAWNQVENFIKEKADAIVISRYERPEIDIAQLYTQATFLPGIIYKTANIDDTVMGNMSYGIAIMFPHLALFAKLINENKDIRIITQSIVSVGNNNDEKTGKYIYTRGYKDHSLHPYLRDMNWLAGYANAIQFVQNKQTRHYIASNNRFFLTSLNSSQVFFINYHEGKTNLFNLLNIFCALTFLQKLKFLFDWIAYFSLYRVIYVFSAYPRPKEEDPYYVKQYWLWLFWFIKIKLFAFKIKIQESCK